MKGKDSYWNVFLKFLPLKRGSQRGLHKKEFLRVKPILTFPFQGRDQTQELLLGSTTAVLA
jgi:hypothetical protein